MKVVRQNLDPTTPIETADRIHFLPNGSLQIVLDDDIFDKYLDTDSRDGMVEA